MDLIVTHENGDFDALAALVAAAKLYPESKLLLPEPLQPNVRSFVNLYRDLLPLSDPKDFKEKIDKLIVVDTNRKERLGKWSELIEQADWIGIYDHHPGEEDFGADLSKIEYVGSTTTLLYELINEKSLPVSDFEATLFALAIYEDTGCLTYDLTTDRDVNAVAMLWRNKINTRMLQEYLRSPLSGAQKNLLEKLIKNSELYEINQRRIMISSTALDEYVAGASVILQLLDEIEDAGITIVIIQMTDSVYLAARSREDDLNLLELLAPYGVKGYPATVSANLKGITARDAASQLEEFLRAYLPPALIAEKIASAPVFTVELDTTLAETDQKLADLSYKGCPVTENGELVGIISRRDLRKGLRNNLGHAPVKGFMARKLITARPDQPLAELRRLMADHNIGRIPIINDQEQLVGIITRSDILRHLSYLDRRGHTVKKNDLVNLEYEGYEQEVEILTENHEPLDHLVDLINRDMPYPIQKVILQISRLAEREKVKVFLVGGIIRDLLLKYPPENDLDLVVLGDAVELTFKLHKLLGGSVRHFQQFGTASLQLKNGLRLDLVTARKEFYASPAALPKVEKSSLKNDLFRRDFTINTMACSLQAESFGKLYDYFLGRRDLQSGLIRALYQLSFVDDPLRIMRAVRFEQRYNFKIEAKTEALIVSAIENKVLDRVSRQRLNQELKLIYGEPSPLRILKRFAGLSVLPSLYPRIELSTFTWHILEEIEAVLEWAASRNWEEDVPDVETAYLSGLLFGLESVDRSAIIRKLSLSTERGLSIQNACREAPKIIEALTAENLSPSTVVKILEGLPLEGLLLIYALAEDGPVRENLKLYMDGLRYIRPRISGSDLKKLGLEPGPRYRLIIEKLKRAVLDGEVRTPQEELDYVIRYLSEERRKEE